MPADVPQKIHLQTMNKNMQNRTSALLKMHIIKPWKSQTTVTAHNQRGTLWHQCQTFLREATPSFRPHHQSSVTLSVVHTQDHLQYHFCYNSYRKCQSTCIQGLSDCKVSYRQGNGKLPLEKLNSIISTFASSDE